MLAPSVPLLPLSNAILQCDVVLLEASSRLGGHADTIEVKKDGKMLGLIDGGALAQHAAAAAFSRNVNIAALHLAPRGSLMACCRPLAAPAEGLLLILIPLASAVHCPLLRASSQARAS